MNCAGVVIKKMAKKYGVKLPATMPDFVFPRYCNTQELRDYLSDIGLVVSYSETKQASFFFKDLEKNGITLLISYMGINGDGSKHVEVVQDMDSENRIKLPHINRWIKQSEFNVVIFTFVSNKDISGVVDFF